MKLSPSQKSALAYAAIGRLSTNMDERWQIDSVSRTFGNGTIFSLFGVGLMEGDHQQFSRCRQVWASAKGRRVLDEIQAALPAGQGSAPMEKE